MFRIFYVRALHSLVIIVPKRDSAGDGIGGADIMIGVALYMVEAIIGLEGETAAHQHCYLWFDGGQESGAC